MVPWVMPRPPTTAPAQFPTITLVPWDDELATIYTGIDHT